MKNIILTICLFITIACSSEKQERTLTIGVMPSMDYLPLAVAAQQGYFDALGINVTIQKFYSANDRDAAFQSGNIDGTVIDYTGAVLQKAGGIKLKLVSKCDAPFYIIAGKASGIKTVKELMGKQIAVSQNTVIDYCVDMALKYAGLSDKDVIKVEINKIPLRFEMLRNNKIDSTGLPDPLATMAKSLGDTVLTSNAELGFAITGIMFADDALKVKREEIKKLYIAYNMGVDYIKNSSMDKLKNILIEDMGFSEELLPIAQLPNYTHAIYPTDNDIDSVVKWLMNRGLVDTSFRANELIETEILPSN